MNKEKVEQLGASFGVAVAEASVALVDIVKEALAGQSINLPLTVAPVAEQEAASAEAPKKPARKRTTRAKKSEEEAPKAEAPKAEAPEVMPLKPEAPKATPKKDEAPKAETPKAETPKAEVEVVAGDISISELRQIGTQLLTAATKAGQDGGAVLSEVVGTITLPNGTPAPNLSSVPVTEYATLKGRLEEAIAKYNADPLG